MNSNQKLIIWISILLFTGMGIIHHWVMTGVIDGVTYSKSIGYSFIFSPPEDANTLDFLRLFVQWFVLIMITFALVMTFKETTGHNKIPPEATPEKPVEKNSEQFTDVDSRAFNLQETSEIIKDKRSFFAGNELNSTLEGRQNFPTLQELAKREAEELFNGELLETLSAGRSIVFTSLSFHKNGRLLATGDDQRSIRLWDIKRGIEVKEMKGHLNLISSIAFSPDGKKLVSASTDRRNESGEIHIWGPFE